MSGDEVIIGIPGSNRKSKGKIDLSHAVRMKEIIDNYL